MREGAGITELAFLRVRDSHGPAFEAAFAGAAGVVKRAEGHLGHRLVRAVDHADLYLLEVHWRDLAAHVEVFEASGAHAVLMETLEPFLVDEPHVIHVPAHPGMDLPRQQPRRGGA